MSDNLTQVMLEFSANFDSFDSALKRAENRASQASKLIEKDFKLSVADDKIGANVAKIAKEQQRMAKEAANFAANTQLLASKRSFELEKQAAQQKLAYSKLAAKLEDSQAKATQKYRLAVAKIASNIELINAKKRNGEMSAAAAKAATIQLNAAKQAQKATLNAAKSAAKASYESALDSAKVQANALKKTTQMKFDIKLDTLERVREATAGKQTSTLLRPLTKMVDVLGDLLTVSNEGTKNQDKTRQQIKKESSTSLGGRIIRGVENSIFEAGKKAVAAEFNTNFDYLDKAFAKIVPSSRMIAEDFASARAYISKVSGLSEAMQEAMSNIATNFADASAESKTLKELGKRGRGIIKEEAVNFAGSVKTKTSDKLTTAKQEVYDFLTDYENLLAKVTKNSRVAKTILQNISKALDKPLANRKDRIQTERLPNILTRSKQLLEEDVKPSGKMKKKAANVLAAEVEKYQELILVAGGQFTDINSALSRATQILKGMSAEQKKTTQVVGLTNPDTYNGYDNRSEVGAVAGLARGTVRGFSRDAEEITAQAIAAMIKNPELKVKIVAESAGGLVAEEVINNLNKLGFGDRVQGEAYGTPMLKTATQRPANMKSYLGTNKQEDLGKLVKGVFEPLGMMDTRGRSSQNMKGLSSHALESYMDTNEFQSNVFRNKNKGFKQEKLNSKKIKQIEEWLKEDVSSNSIDKIEDIFTNLRDTTQMRGASAEKFESLEAKAQKFIEDSKNGIVDSILEIERGVSDALFSIERNLYNLDAPALEQDEAELDKLRQALALLKLSVTGYTAELVDSVEKTRASVASQIPKNKDPVLIRANLATDYVADQLPLNNGLDALGALGDELTPSLEQVKQLADSPEKKKTLALLRKQLKTIEVIQAYIKEGIAYDLDEVIKSPAKAKKQLIAKKKIISNLPQPVVPATGDFWQDDQADKAAQNLLAQKKLAAQQAKKESERQAKLRFKGALDAPSIPNPFEVSKPQRAAIIPAAAKAEKTKLENPLVAIKKDTSEIVTILKGASGTLESFIKKFGNQERKSQIKAQIESKKLEPRKNNVLGFLNGVVARQLPGSNPNFKHSALPGTSEQKALPGAGGALTKAERKAEILRVQQLEVSGGLAIQEPEYHQTRKMESGNLTVAQAAKESVKDLASFAVGLEQATLTVMPFGQVIKKVIQAAAIVGTGVVATQIPGVSLAAEGITSVGAGIIDAIAAGFGGIAGGVAEAAVTTSAGAIAGAVADTGVVGSGMIADAIITAGSAMASAAGVSTGAAVGVGADVAMTVGAVALPALTAVKITQDKLQAVSEAWLGDTTEAAEQGRLLGSNVKLLAANYKAQADLVRLDIGNLAEIKKLPQAEKQQKLSEQIYLLEQHIKQAEIALVDAKGDAVLTKEIKAERKKLKAMLKTRQKAAKESGGVQEVTHNSEAAYKMKVIQQVGRVPDLGKQMKEKGQDFIDGFKLTVKASKEFGDVAEDAANQAIKGFAKGQDSASPSKKMKRLAKDFKDGFVGTLQADGDFFSAAKNAALHAVEGFSAPLESAKIEAPATPGEAIGQGLGEAQKALSALMAQLRLPGSGFAAFFRDIEKGFKATGAGATKLKLQIGALLTVGGFMAFKNQIISVGKSLFNAALEMEVVQKKMNSVNMGGQDPFKTFGASANKAGLSVKEYANNFAGMVQTMNRNVPNADKVFESLTEGLKKRGVVGDAMTRSMEALSQISSKGVVSMEELRQQLGEALPGAMTIAADSMGMTNGQFMKMVESGELLSSDFLPKFGMALNNVTGGDLPSLNTELQTAKNNIDGILAQSASTIPFTEALQSFNTVVSQSAEFLKLFVPLLGVGFVGAAGGALTVIAPMVLGISAVGAALSAAFTGGAVVAGIAAMGAAVTGLVQYLKGAGTEFDRIGEKMEKTLNPDVAKKSRLVATGTIARLNDSLTSFFTPGQSSKFAEKETIEVRNQADRQIQKQQDAINKAAKKLTEGNINQTKTQVSPLVVEKQKLQIKLANADVLGLSQDAKKNITQNINDIDAEIKDIAEKTLGSEIDVNTTLKATLESKAALEADAKARGEDVTVLYNAQYQNLVKQEQVLKSMVAKFAAVAGFSNNQLKAQKEMNSLLSLGTKVSEKEGVMETLAAYKELESLTTTMAGFDSASMVIDIAVKEGAVKEIEAQISSIDAFVSTSMGTAQEQVINKAFKNGWKKATAKEIADFKVQIESGALGEVDKAVVSMVESLEKKSDLEKELGQTNIDLIKANRQLEQALLDLNDARLNQQMQGNQTEMSLIQLVADLNKMSPENSKEVYDASNSNIDFRLQQQESLRNLSVSFRSFGEALTDAADSLKSGIASMNEEIRATAASLKTTALSGATAFANAAGIEDTLGLGRLLDLASEKINIKASDKTASIERQQASENKTDKRQVRDFTEQREGLNREADRASMEIVRAIENNNFDMKDLEVNFELSGLQLQDKLDSAVRDVTGLERSTNEFNDRALGFGQAPVDVDISGLKNRLAQIQTMVTEGADSGAIVQALYDLKVQQNADAQEFLSGIQATKTEGNQGLTQKINDITALNKEKNAAFETQKGMEKERVELELDINDEKFQGTLVDIKRKLKEAGLSAVKTAEGIGLSINDKLATVGLGANPYDLLRMESKRWKRDTLADIDAQQKALKESLDMLGEGGNTADNKLNVQANLNNSNLDAETKDSLVGQLASVKTAQEFEAYIKSVKDSLASLDASEKQVLSNADDIEARAVKLAKAKDLLAKNNTLTGEKQSFLDSVDTSRLSGGEERELELAKKKLKINQDYANKIAQINEDASTQPNLYGGDVQKNRTNMALEEQANLLKKAQKEASILNDIYANLSTAGADAIKSAILGIGEAILSNKPKQEEQDKLDADYAERLSSLVEGYTGSAEELQYAKDQLDNQRDDIQGEIDSKLSKTAQLFDVLKGALSGFAQSIAQVAAQMAATAAIKGIAGAIGGGWGSLAGSLIGGANMGGQAGVDVISNYSMGGTAGIKNALALQAGIGKAMQREGRGAMPIVVHKGEQILTTKNGDAQLFRALKAQGEWDNIKQANVSNYANGGTAGYSGNAGGGYSNRRGMTANSNTYYSSNVTVVASDIGSFKKNEQVLMRETEAAQTRSVRRGLG